MLNWSCIAILLALYYIMKFKYNKPLIHFIRIINILLLVAIFIVFIFTSEQQLFDILFAWECLGIVFWIYSILDKNNYEVYSELAKVTTIPIMLGWEWFFRNKELIPIIRDFLSENHDIVEKNSKFILLGVEDGTIELCIWSKKRIDMQQMVFSLNHEITSSGNKVHITLKKNG